MTLPELIPRRPLDDDNPEGYQESDRDFFENNQELVLALLELYGEGRIVISEKPKPPECMVCGIRAGLFRNLGSGGPWRCDSPDCVPF